jgi:Histidine kinase-like ATPase domain
VRGRRRAASELFSNSIRHSGSGAEGETVTIAVRAVGGVVRVDVTDRGGRGVPPLRPSGDEAEGGRGLGLVRPGTHDLPPQDRNLMAQHQDLSILGCVAGRQKRQPSTRTINRQIKRMSTNADRN